MSVRRHEISNQDDVIDSRDVIRRIAELEDEVKQECGLCHGSGELDYDDKDSEKCPDCEGSGRVDIEDEDAIAELKALKALEDECNYGDWHRGETLIRDSYFEDYARQTAEDLGYISGDEHWPHDCIDWEKAAGALQQDYSQVDYDGVTYWIRA